MASSASRDDQKFPVLDVRQVAVARRFSSAEPVSFQPGAAVLAIGETNASSWLVLDGQLEILSGTGLRAETPIVTLAAGQFSGEVSQLSARPSLVGARAGAGGCKAIPFDAAHVRALIVGSAEIGELVMRAFILRRVALIDSGASGSVLIGTPGSGQLVRLEGFLRRNGYPYIALDATSDAEGLALVQRLGIASSDLPIMVCPAGTVLKNPNEAAVARCLGITPTLDKGRVYDVAIVGAGPAGLAAAVYGGSEGLDVLVLEQAVAGGQAGASMRIENYLGFPTGITGQALMGRAFNQALKFGAEIALPLAVANLIAPENAASGPFALTLSDGQRVSARTVVIASGARYRQPSIPRLADFQGSGVSYWVSPIEARLCGGEDVALIGGGNSAGQAVVYLAPQVRRLHLVVRRPLDETMSAYLVERIAALGNVDVHVHSEIVGITGDEQGKLSSSVIRDLKSGVEKPLAVQHLFIFIGADPNTEWLPSGIAVDGAGFIATGEQPRGDIVRARPTLPLETSVPNVFAIGDIRAGSTKRVAAAVGEGATVVSQIHEALKVFAGAEVVEEDRLLRSAL